MAEDLLEKGSPGRIRTSVFGSKGLANSRFCSENLLYDEVRDDFKNWLLRRMSEATAKCYVSYLDRHLSDSKIEGIDDLLNISAGIDSGWNWYAKSVRNLINYYWENRLISKEWGIELKETLKLKKIGTDTYVPSDGVVQSMLLKCNNPDMQLLMQLVYFSGIRVTEAVKILNEFDPKRMHQDGDVTYYDIDWERGTKKAFKAFMPSDFANQLCKMNLSVEASRKYFRACGLGLKYGRNYFIDKCVKAGIQESLIKYMIGHSNGSVLMTNYLDKLNNSTVSYEKVMPALRDVMEG